MQAPIIDQELEDYIQKQDVINVLNCLEKGASAKVGLLAASRVGNLEIFVLCLDRNVNISSLGEICNNATELGHMDLLKLAYEKGAPISKWTCMVAAKANQFEALKWLHGKGAKCNDMICAYAALNGNFEMLQWARENNLPWSIYTPASAAAGGHLEILKWVIANGCPWSNLTFANATKAGQQEILDWLKAEGYNKNTSPISVGGA